MARSRWPQAATGVIALQVDVAGSAPQSRIEDFTAESIARLLGINFNGVVWCVQASTKAFRKMKP